MLVYTNKIDLLRFSLYLSFICCFIYVFSNKNFFSFLILSLKSYYIFLLSFTTIFSLYEVASKNNIYFLALSNNKFIKLFLASIILYFLCEFLFFKNFTIDKFKFMFSSLNMFIPIFIFILLIVKNYSFFFILNFSKHSHLVSTMFLTSSLIEIFFCIFIIIGISKAYDLSIYKHKNKILNMQYELQVNNLNQLEEYQSDIRRISHDIINHKIILYNLIKNEDYTEALKYLEKFGTGFNSTNYEVFTNHKILNALFLKKKEICISNNINIKLDINIPTKVEISDFDLCIIIGNLIDNSIDACKKSKNEKPSYINIKSKIINNNFVFEIKNNFDGLIKTEKKIFLTSKKDSINHGFGLSNVKSTVLKYNGCYEFSFDSNEFSSFVMIPIK